MRGAFNLFKMMYKGKSLFIKTQIFIIVVIILPIFIIGYSYYTKSRDIILSNSSEASKDMLGQINVSVDLVIENIIDISKQSYNDRSLNDIMQKEKLDSYNDADILMKKLDQIKHSNRYIYSISLYMDKSRKIISSEYGPIDLENSVDKHFMEWYRNSEINLILDDTHPVSQSVFSNEVDHVFSVYARLPMDRTYNFIGALIINIKQALIFNQIIKNLDVEEDVLFFIADANEKIIFSKDENNLYRKIDTIPYLKGRMKESSGYYIMQINQSPHLVVYNKLEKRNWSYIMVYPFKEVYNTITGIRNLVIVISLLLILLCSVVSSIVISRAFKPLNEVTDFIQSRVRSTKENKDGSLKDVISEVFSNNEKMKENLEITIPLFKEKFLLNLITRNNYNRTDIEEQIRRFSIDIPVDRLILTIFDIDNYDLASHRKIYDDYITKLSVIRITEDCFATAGSRLFCVETEPGRITVVVHMESEGIKDLLITLKEVQNTIYEQLGISITIGVCDRMMRVNGLNDCYLHTLETLKYKILYGKQEIILYSDIKQDNNSRYKYPYNKEEHLKNFIRVIDREKALAALRDMLQDISKSKSYFLTQQCIYQLNASIMKLLDEMCLPTEQFYTDMDMEANKLNFGSIYEVESFFTAIIDKIIKHIEQSRESKMDRYYHKIILFLHENYMTDMAVEQVCGYINLSPTYVHQILKKYTGKTFIQYLNEYRIKKACEYLENDNMKIMEIAEKVGFGSTKYFIKIFKELKGITPGDYKK